MNQKEVIIALEQSTGGQKELAEATGITAQQLCRYKSPHAKTGRIMRAQVKLLFATLLVLNREGRLTETLSAARKIEISD